VSSGEPILESRDHRAVGLTYKSPLHQMASTTATDYWNDSCSVEELTYAIENGAVNVARLYRLCTLAGWCNPRFYASQSR
jgi:hypothetical protein